MAIINRIWEMPNHRTFDIKCINKLIHKYYTKDMFSIDPFANENTLATIRNDLNESFNTDYHLDALDFLKIWDDNSVDFVFYDPPYSLRQVVECYKSVGKVITQEDTQSSWRSKHLDEIARILKSDGICISFGWNSNGVGIKRGFSLLEILMVAHGGRHNDTICVVEQKGRLLF